MAAPWSNNSLQTASRPLPAAAVRADTESQADRGKQLEPGRWEEAAHKDPSNSFRNDPCLLDVQKKKKEDQMILLLM